MKFNLLKIGRTVDIDDNIAKEYQKFKDIRENLFLLNIYSEFGKYPNETEVTDSDLSLLCNKTLVEDLENMAIHGTAIKFLEENPAMVSMLKSQNPVDIEVEVK